MDDGWDTHRLRRRGASGVLAALLVVACSGPIAVSELGQSCSGVGDRFNPAYYFGEVSRLDRVPAGALAEATRSGPVTDTKTDVLAVLDLSIETIFDDGEVDSLTALWLDPASRGETARLPEDRIALLAVRSPSARYPGEAWVQFVAIPTADGDLVFTGDCADQIFRAPLEAFRDAMRPGQGLESVFVEVVTRHESWLEFNEFDCC